MHAWRQLRRMLLVISLTLPPAFAPAPRVSPKRGPALALRVGIPTLLDPEATRDAADGYVGVAAALAEAQAETGLGAGVRVRVRVRARVRVRVRPGLCEVRLSTFVEVERGELAPHGAVHEHLASSRLRVRAILTA